MKIIKIDGLNFAITDEGRFRKNWKESIRSRDRKRMPRLGVCSRCNEYKELTVHHDPPLSESLEGDMEGICDECHVEHNRKEAMKNRYNPHFVIFCKCGNYNYLQEKWNAEGEVTGTYLCCGSESCGTIRVLEKIKKDEYKLGREIDAKEAFQM